MAIFTKNKSKISPTLERLKTKAAMNTTIKTIKHYKVHGYAFPATIMRADQLSLTISADGIDARRGSLTSHEIQSKIKQRLQRYSLHGFIPTVRQQLQMLRLPMECQG